MVSPYLMIPGAQPRDLLRMLEAEAPHMARLAETSRMWTAAATLVDTAVTNLNDRKEALKAAWDDEAGRVFQDRVNESLRAMVSWQYVITNYGLPDIPGKSVSDSVPNRIADLVEQYPKTVDAVRRVCDDYDRAVAESDGQPVDVLSFISAMAPALEGHDSRCEALERVFRSIVDNTDDWAGPRAAIPGSHVPGAPAPGGATPPGGTDVPGAPQSVPDPGAVDPGTTPGAPAAPSDAPGPTDALDAAARALEAAQGLLGGAQVPGATMPDLSGLDPWEFPDTEAARYAEYGQPSLAGFDAGAYGGYGGYGGSTGGGATAGGVGAGSPTPTSPGTAIGAGTPPMTMSGVARAAGSTPSGPGAMPPMVPPHTGAGNTRSAPGGVKPGTSDRPAGEQRPRPRRNTGPVTPGVALTGRAGAAAPKPAARRGWDSDNDSLQVLDEHLWQVHPQEEETHGQDRREPGRDGRDRTAAHRAPDAGLAGPGRRADQSPRAR